MSNVKKKKYIRKRKKNKNLKLFVEFIISSVIILSVFQLRSVYGKIFMSEKVVDNKNNQEENVKEVQNNQDENNKQEEKVKLTDEQKTEEINKIINSYSNENNKISVVYNNLSSGYRYAINDKEYFSAASTSKVIYALYVYDRIAKGEISEDQMIAYNKNKLSQGGGEITNQPKKDKYPLSDLLMNMIVYSDNTATNMILGNDANAEKVVNYYLKKLEITVKEGMVSKNKLNTEIMEKVWQYVYKNQDKYPKLIEHLKESENNEWIKNGITGKTIASKYGAIDNFAHDTSIVYSEEKGDYILLIYTQGVAHSADVIANIAEKINKLHDDNA